ncbi:GtrA family protein [Limnohabitans sp. 2KL-3]|uniref:GtrA family protein n=1 Tax=Limnohabitans sp. 2KL-3 TaxID=1100700 RepID=UPI000B2E9128|nr:GtrA family protein [Limnohabitans sp. 2KL-3]
MNRTWLGAVLQPQFLVYIAVGAFTALVDIGTMALLLKTGSPVQLATTAGFVLGLAVNYLLHTRFTFMARMGWQNALRFWVIVAVNYGLTLMFVWAALWLGFDAIAGKVASLPVLAIHGFLMGKFWAFR